MGRHGENIRKRADGRWEARYIQYYDSRGKAVYRYIYGKTYADKNEITADGYSLSYITMDITDSNCRRFCCDYRFFW